MKLIRHLLIMIVIAASFLINFQSDAQEKASMWVTAFYPIFWDGWEVQKKIDYTAFTHLITFTTEVSATTPYFREMPGTADSGYFDGNGRLKAMVDSCHKHGVKALFCVAGLGGTSMANASAMYSDPTKRTEYIHYVLGKNGWAKRRNFDGVDFDFEYPSWSGTDSAGFRAFVRQVRDTLDTWNPRGLLTFDIVADVHKAWTGDVALFNSDKVDQLNMMMYGMSAGSSVVGHSSPLYQPKSQYPNYNGSSWFNNPYNQGMTAWIKAGINRKKLGVLIPFEMEKTTGVDGIGQTRTSAFQFVNYSEVVAKLAQYPSGYKWDSEAMVPSLGFTENGTKYFYTFENPASIKLKIQAAKDSGIGGIGIWELGRGYVPGATPPDQLLQTVKTEMNLGGVVTPPDPPTLATPANNATNQALSSTLTWNLSTGATSYQLQVSTSSSFTTIVVNQSNITTTSQIVSGLTNGSTYYWRVNATNNGGTSTWSNPSFNFTTLNSAPATPSLSTPATGSINIATNPTLSWNAVSGATSYCLHVSSNSMFSDTVFTNSSIATTSQQLSGLNNNTTYFWRVSAANSVGSSGWSNPVFSFTTLGNVPVSPTLLSPTNGSTGNSTNPILSWNASSGATSYQLHVSNNSAFSDTVFNNASISTTSQQLSGLNNNITYYWRVSAKNSAGSSGWSNPVFSFITLGNAPVTPTLLSPTNGSTGNSINPILSWNASGDATSYQLYVSSSSTFTDTVYSNTNILTTSQQLQGLKNSTIYYWKVSATNSVGNSGWANTWSFNTDSVRNNPENGNKIILYDDSLKSPWTNASWSSTVTYPSAEQIFTGSSSIKANSSAWGALRLLSGTWTTPLNTDVLSSDSLRLSVFNTTSGLSVRIYLENVASQTFPQIVINNLPINQWQIISIPTAQLNPDGFNVNFVTIQNFTSGTQAFFVDDLRFKVKESLTAPVLLSPTNASINQPTSITFSWNATPNAVRYHLQLAKDSNFTSLMFNDSSLTLTTQSVQGLINGTNYFWRVRAVSGSLQSIFSNTFSFLTMNSKPKFDFDRFSLDFGKVIIGTIKKDSITVTNTGTISVNISKTQSTSSDFLVNPTNFQLEPGAKQKMYIKFSPTLKTLRTGLVFAISESDTIRDTVSVRGTGVNKPRNFRNPGTVTLTSAKGVTSATDSFYVHNDGEVDLVIDQILSNRSNIVVYPNNLIIAPYDSQCVYVSAVISESKVDSSFIIFTDNSIKSPDSMQVKVLSMTEVGQDETISRFSVQQNYPNPFNPSTTIAYTLVEQCHVSIKIFDVLGQEVTTLVDEVQGHGEKNIIWNSTDKNGALLPSGIYFYRITINSGELNRTTFSETRKMILMK
jgi:GH18 family chitinase